VKKKKRSGKTGTRRKAGKLRATNLEANLRVKNLVEDLLDYVLKDMLAAREDICRCESCYNDMASYALNRYAPYYITSERGITHRAILEESDPQRMADLVVLANQAIEVVSSRVRGYSHGLVSTRPQNPRGKGFFNFPYIIGNVISERDLMPPTGFKVTLILGNKPTPMNVPSWQNPTILQKGQKGYFNFWPKGQSTSSTAMKKFSFRLCFEKKGFETKEFDFDLFLKPDSFFVYFPNRYHIHRIPTLSCLPRGKVR